MRKVFLACGLLLTLAGGVRSATEELDIDLMQTIEDTNKSLASSIALKQAERATSDAKELTEMFAKVEQHFATKGEAAAEAVLLAKKSRELAKQIVQSVASGDYAGAIDSATTLSRTCRTCHTFYKKS